VAMTQNDESATSGYVASASSTINNNGLVYPSFAGDGGTTSWTSQNSLFDTNDPYEALNTASLFDGQRGEWIQLQLPNAIKVSYFKIIPRSTAGGTNAAPEDQTKRGSLYGSNDGTNFTKLIDYGDLDYGGATGQNVQIIHVNATEHYKYLRLLCTARYGNYNNQQWIGVGELEYYGYEEGSGSIDTTLKSVYNVPATTGTQLEVYYDGQDYTADTDFDQANEVLDKSGNNLHGSQTGGVGFDSTWKAFSFDGTGDYITNTRSGYSSSGTYTVSTWVNISKEASGQTNPNIFQYGIGQTSTTDTGIGLITNSSDDRIQAFVYGNNDFVVYGIKKIWYMDTSDFYIRTVS